MKFSLLYEMQLTDPDPASEQKLFHDCVEQAVLADELGYHCIWAVEHHGLYEYAHSSAPEIFLTFLAARTGRIRLGHGVTLLPYRYNHPIRLAERVATLDIYSRGRVNWGVGKSASLVELQAFENDLSTLNEQFLEALEMIPRMWSSEIFEHKGRFFDIPPTPIVPKPVQTPHPPIFAACSRLESVTLAGQLGVGALNFAFGTEEELRTKVTNYRAAIATASPVGRAKNDSFSVTASALVLEDDLKACRYGVRGARFFTEGLKRLYQPNSRPIGRLPIERGFPTDRQLDSWREVRDAGYSFGSVIGDPTRANDEVARLVNTGVDEIILIMQMGTVPHELIMESIRTFGEKILPKWA